MATWRARASGSRSEMLIGATALEIGYSVVTNNVRHFQMIPDLVVRHL